MLMGRPRSSFTEEREADGCQMNKRTTVRGDPAHKSAITRILPDRKPRT